MAQRNDYGELFCEAVDTIVQERLSHVSFDKTILCSIIDDTQRDSGLYIVSENNSTKFEAYSSDTSYRKGNNVYVSIPGGDWNQQKIIVAKKTTDTIEPYTYQKPFYSLVDITGNLYKNGEALPKGLTANAYTENIDDKNQDPYQAITLWETNEIHCGYTRLGIQAGFQSWVDSFYLNNNQYKVAQGEYGLRLRIAAERDHNINEDFGDEGTVIYEVKLNQTDMNGNPYNFNTFFEQEKVFDISEIGKITKMELQFYQVPDSFAAIDSDDNDNLILLPYKDFLGHITSPNLFVNDVYITLGYDISDFDKELVQIYTLDPQTYSRSANPLSNNNKQLQLRWIHKENGVFKSITDDNDDDLDYKVQWYRYVLGAGSADQYSGVSWKKLSVQENGSYEIQDEEWLDYNTAAGESGGQLKPDFFTSWAIPDVTLQTEKYKAIITYDGNVYRSNIIEFTNENEVVSKPTIDAVQALSISCDDNTYGNYRIYNLGNSLIDSAQSHIIRKWTANFRSAMDKDAADVSSPLTEAESIEWIIPTTNTMIVVDETFRPETNSSIETEKDRYYVDSTGLLHIIRLGKDDLGINMSNDNYQQYRIKSYYSQNASNNTIQCKVVKDKTTYTATKELTFGPAGTSGADVTLVLDFDEGKTAVDLDNPDKAIIITARLYDYANNEIDLSRKKGDAFEYPITWSWFTGNHKDLENKIIYFDDDSLLPIEGINNKREIKLASPPEGGYSIGENYYILQARIKDWNGYADGLIAYLPIPIKSGDVSYISGSTNIVYQSSGELMDYFKNPYYAYDSNSTILPDWEWQCVSGDATEDKPDPYAPKIEIGNLDGLYRLAPLSFYVEGSNQNVCLMGGPVDGQLWSQPLLIIQNRYPSATLNKWDGNLDVGVSEPGTILAPRLAAGKKEKENNTFTGVVLGDWSPQDNESSLSTNTGLFGFKEGEQVFGFKDDGTAFIGKSGGGRLLFDGNKATIKSASYLLNDDGSAGMLLDFDDGIIKAFSGDNKISIDASVTSKPFTIGSGTSPAFSVDWDGSVNASAFTIKATMTSHWADIGNGMQVQIPAGNITISSTAAKPLVIGSHFSVDWDGSINATSGTFAGNLQAAGGTFNGTLSAQTISGITISANQITTGSISADRISGGTLSGVTLSIGNGRFYVDPNGNMSATSGSFSGTVTAANGSSFGGFTSSDNDLNGLAIDIFQHADGQSATIQIKSGKVALRLYNDTTPLGAYLNIDSPGGLYLNGTKVLG